MSNQPPLLFLGNESLSTHPDYNQTPILNKLVADGWPVKAVVIKHQPARSRRPIEPAVIEAAQKAGIELVTVKSRDDLRKTVKRYPTRLGLLASFGLIVPDDVLEQFDLGLINVHPSLLPAYRGTTPIESVIADGQTRTGVSLIKTIPAMDAGPIYAQQVIDIESQISKLKLTTIMGQLAADLVATRLPQIAQKEVEPQTQDETLASFTLPLSAKDRPIKWSLPAEKVERLVRAQAGWPGSTIDFNQQAVKVAEVALLDEATKGSPGKLGFDNQSRKITIDCQPGKIGIASIQIPGKKPITAEDFRNSYDLGFD